MAKLSPITITLYDQDDNPTDYTRGFVPLKVLRLALKFVKGKTDVELNEPSDEMINELETIIVETFGGKFSMRDLDEGADVNEMMAVLRSILARAGGNSENPPPQG